MNTIALSSLRSVLSFRRALMAVAGVIMSLGVANAALAEDTTAVNNDVCVTSTTRVALNAERGVVEVFSGWSDSAPNGFLVSEISLSSIPGISDADRAANKTVWLVSQDSEYASGWHVNLYWYQDHYGATVTGPTFSDDTGASCAL